MMSETPREEKTDYSLDEAVACQLDELEFLVRRCGALGTMSLWTIVAMILIAVFPLVVSFIFHADTIPGIFSTLAATLFASLLYLLLVYERCRRRGRVLYEELSDELQWRIAEEDEKQRFLYRKRRNPGIRARVILRSFVYDSDLPMLSGNTAVFVYFVSGVVLLFAAVWFDSFYSRGL